MNTYVNKKVSILAMEHRYEAYAMRILSFALVLLVCAYLYLVAASILQVIARKEAMAQASQLQTSVGDLDARYFQLSQSITPQEGTALGLQVLKPNYVYRSETVGVANEVAGKEI